MGEDDSMPVCAVSPPPDHMTQRGAPDGVCGFLSTLTFKHGERSVCAEDSGALRVSAAIDAVIETELSFS